MSALPSIVTGRYGIGRIGRQRLNKGMLLLRTSRSFECMKDMALDALKRGDREGARFYGAQARSDWASIRRQLHTL